MTGVQDDGQDRVEVALAVVVDNHHVLKDPADQLAIIDDVVGRWRVLDDAERQRYADPTNHAYSDLMRFAWEYVNTIDDAALVDVPEPCTNEAVKSARLRHWGEHVQRLRAASDRGRTAARLLNGSMPINAAPAPGRSERCGSERTVTTRATHPERTTTVTGIDSADLVATDGELPMAPLVEVCVALIPGLGLEVRRDRCEGDLPLLEVVTGHARLLVSFDVGDVRQLGTEHAILTEQFAQAAAALHDETRKLVANR